MSCDPGVQLALTPGEPAGSGRAHLGSLEVAVQTAIEMATANTARPEDAVKHEPHHQQLRSTSLLLRFAAHRILPQSPAIIIRSISQEPVCTLVRVSMSVPTSSSPMNISLRLPAMVISSTGYWISPPSTQKPAAPRE